MKNNKYDSNKSHSNKEEQTQKITSPHKKSLSFASSSPSQTNNSSFSRNSSEDIVALKEGTTFDLHYTNDGRSKKRKMSWNKNDNIYISIFRCL